MKLILQTDDGRHSELLGEDMQLWEGDREDARQLAADVRSACRRLEHLDNPAPQKPSAFVAGLKAVQEDVRRNGPLCSVRRIVEAKNGS